MKIQEMIAAVQTALNIDSDGRAGPQTWEAIHKHVVGPVPVAADALVISTVDPRSEKCIATLLPEVRPFARALVQNAAAAGITIKIISGLRTYVEQNQLYAQGRTVVPPDNRVTNARGGFSNHNFGIAFDVGVFEKGVYLGDSPKYAAVGVLGQELGLDWGGKWKTFKDMPHFQLRPTWALEIPEREMLANLRERKSVNKEVFV